MICLRLFLFVIILLVRMHNTHRTLRVTQRGFALILVLGVLAVAALIIGTMLAREENEAVWRPVTQTKDQLDEVQRALAAYERTEHRLPMPAARTEDAGIALHVEALSLLAGSETDPEGYRLPTQVANQLTAGSRSVELAGGIRVASNDPTNLRQIMIVGAVPTEALGLSREAAEDKNGHLLTYAVTFELLDRFKYKDAEGAIQLKDANGATIANNMAYVVLSHGKNAKGAWSAKNRVKGRECLTAAGGESGDDGNCAHDGASFVVSDLSLVRGDNYFDDQMVRGSKDRIAISQNISCIGPIDVTWGDDLCPGCTCDGKIPAPGLVSSGTHGAPKTVDLKDTTLSDIGDATFECINGAAQLVPDSNTCTRPCILPWGGTLENGDSVTAYSTGSVACGNSCPSPTARMCVNGTLTGSGDYPSCSEAGGCTPDSCSLPWGGSIDDGDSVQAYSVSISACDESCPAPVTRTCTNGVLSGSGNFASCADSGSCAAGSCALPWGGSIDDGQSVQAYASDSVACGETCAAPVTRTCTNGVLSGSGDHASCEVLECGSCALPWGGSIDDGDSVQAYASDSVACGETCAAPTTRTCNNGVLSGSGDHESCTVNACGSCALPWGGSIADGESVDAYSVRYVRTCGGACPAPVTRTCTNGVLSGSGNWQACAEEPDCAPCSLPWGGAIAHGDRVTAYQAAINNQCQVGCNPEQRICTDGTLSGSYTNASCQDLTCQADCNAGGGDGCVNNGQTWTTKCQRGWKWTFRCENGSNTQVGGGASCTGDEMCF